MVNAVDPHFEFFDDSILEFTTPSPYAAYPHMQQRVTKSTDDVPTYSPRLAYTLAVASKIVYEDIGVIEHELEKDGFDMSTFRPMAYRVR